MSHFKIALYVRCSTEEQGSRANPEGTIKNQEQRLRQEILFRNRATPFGELAAVFIDDGVSAKDTKRPALQQMLRAIENGEVTMVMVTEYSRLSRNMRDFASMWELCKSYKCSLISLRENFDTSSAAGEMMLYNMANLAQFERRLTSERVVLSRFDRAQRGLFNGGVIPLGYKKSERPGHLEIDKEDGECVKMAFATFLKQGSVLATAKWLNDNHYIPNRMIDGGGRKARVGHFTVGNLRFLLTNKVYAGICAYKKKNETFESNAAWPAIVSIDDFKKVQEMIAENHRKKKPHTQTRYPYTLTGLVFCKACGDVMCGKSAHGKYDKVGYYEHSWAMRKNAALTQKVFSCSMHKRVPARKLEPLIHGEIQKLLSTPELAQSIVDDAKKLHAKIYSADEREKTLKREVSSLTLQLASLSERLAKAPAGVPLDGIYTTMQQLGEKRDKSQEELDHVLRSSTIGSEMPVELSDYQKFLEAMKLIWLDPQSSSELKQKVIKKLVAKIEVDVDKVEVEFVAEKNHFKREIKTIVSRPLEKEGLQVAEISKMSEDFLKNVCSSTCQNGAQSETRTRTSC
jgi:site-specific DNA recombinase